MAYSIIKAIFLSWICWFSVTTDAATCSQRPADFIFLVDGSRSVRPTNFALVKSYIKNFASDFGDFARDNIQMGVVQFSTNVQEEIHLGEYRNSEDFNQAVDDIVYMKMGTMTGEALKFVVTQVLQPSRGSRLDEGIHTILIIVTDGKSQDHARGEFTKYEKIAKKRGVEVFAVGIGRRLNLTELTQLASKPKRRHVYQVQRFEDIPQLKLYMPDQKICAGKNECESNVHNCSQLCVDTAESHTCACRDGFELQADGRTCLPSDSIKLSKIWFSNITHTSARVHWNTTFPLGDEVVYILGYSKLGGKARTLSIPGRTTLLQNLDPSTKYLVQVSFLSAQHFSLPIEGTFSTLRLGRTSVSVTNRTMTSFIIHWTEATGDGVTSYGIEYFPRSLLASRQSGSILDVFTGLRSSAGFRKYTATSLEPNTNYVVKVTPLHGNFRGITNMIKARTLPLTVPFIAVNDPSLSTLTARWKLRYKYRIKKWLLNVYNLDKTINKNYEFDAGVKSTIFKNLPSNTNYTVAVQAVLLEGYGEKEEEIRTAKGYAFKKTKKLIKPEVSVQSVTVSSFVVGWKDLNIAPESWFVKIFPKGQKSLQRNVTVNGDERTKTFTDLLPFTLYKVEVIGRVRERGKIFKSPRGKNKEKTKQMTAPPVTISDVHASYLRASWNTINVVVDEWLVKIYQTGNNAALQETTVAGSQTEEVFTRLEANTEYKVLVVGVITKGEIRRESPEGFATGTTAIEIVSPSITIDNIDPFSMRAHWSDVNFPVATWSVVIRRASSSTSNNDQQEFAIDGNQNYKTFTNLSPDTEYIIQVTGQGDDIRSGTGQQRSQTESLTGPSVEVTDRTMSSLFVRWSDINVPVNRWSITYTNQESETPATFTVSGDKREYLIDDLTPGSPYNIEVVGVITQQSRTYESPAGQTSASTDVLSIPSVNIDNVTPFSMRAEWGDVNYPVDSWIVTIRKNIGTVSSENEEANPITKEFIIEGNQNNKIFINLSPDTEYIVEVTGQVNEVRSKTGRRSSRTDSLVEPAVEATRSTTSTVHVSWTDINVPVEVWLVTYTNRRTSLSKNETLPGSKYDVVLNDLLPRTLYDVVVVGRVSHLGNTYKSPPGRTSFTTEPLVAPLVEIVETTYSTMLVRWVDSNDNVVGWTVVVADNDDNIIKAVTENKTERLFTGLQEGTEYNIEVSGIVKVREYTFDTPFGKTSDSTVSLISIAGPMVECVKTNLTSVDVTWSDVTSEVTSWSVKAFTMKEKRMLQKFMFPEEIKRVSISNLLPQTSYVIQVTGNVREGELLFKTQPGAVNCTTSSLSAPKVVIDSDRTTFSRVAVRWGNISLPVTFWRLQIENNETNFVQRRQVSGSLRSAVFSGLEPETLYVISVTGVVLDERREISSPTGQDRGSTDYFLSPYLECGSPTVSSISVDWFMGNLQSSFDFWMLELRLDEDGEVLESFDVDGRTDERSHIFSYLHPDTSYHVTIGGRVTLDNKTYYADPETVRCKSEGLRAPTVTASEVTSTSFTAEWSDINTSVDSWSVILKKESFSLMQNVAYPMYSYSSYSGDDESLMLAEVVKSITVDGNVNNASFDGLIPQTSYIVEVAGVKKEKSGEKGDTEVLTHSLPRPTMYIYTATPTSLQANWIKTDVPMDSWIVRIYSAEHVTFDENGEREYIQEKIVNGTVLTTTFEDLHPDTLYRITLAGQSSGSTSPTHAILNPTITSWRCFRLLDNAPGQHVHQTWQWPAVENDCVGFVRWGIPPRPLVPLGTPYVHVTFITTTTLTARWDGINTEVDMWKIRLLDNNGDILQTSVRSSSEREAIFDQLSPDTLYKINVSGVVQTSDGTRFESSPGQDFATTDGFDAPIVRIDRVTPTTVGGMWGVLSTPVDSWTVRLRESENPDNIIDEVTLSKHRYSKVFTGLDPGTSYIVETVGNIGSFASRPGRAVGTTESLTAPGVYITSTTPIRVEARWNNFNLLEDYWTVSIRQIARENDERTEPAPPEREIRVDGSMPQNVVFPNLIPGTPYMVEVVGQSGKLTSPPGQARVVTQSVTKPTIERIRSSLTNLTVQWTGINIEVSSWTVQISSELGVYTTTVNGSERQATLGGLSPATEYSIQVSGYNDELILSSDSLTIVASTMSLSPPEVDILNVNSTSVQVIWGDINTPVSLWIVKLLKPVGQAQPQMRRTIKEATIPAFSHTAIFSVLQPNTSYEIEVAGVVQNFTSPFGQASATTESLEAPVVSLISISPTVAEARWNDFGLPEDYWTVTIRELPFDKDETAEQAPLEKVFRIDGDVPQYLVFDDLKPETRYSVEVVGQSGSLTSPTGEASVIMKALTPPSVSITDINPTTVRVLWSEIHAPVQSWSVLLVETKDHQNENATFYRKEVSVNASTLSVVFDSLFPSTLYNVEVVGTVQGFNSPPGRASHRTISLIAPRVEIVNVGVLSLTARWSAINTDVSLWSVQVLNSRTKRKQEFETDPSEQEIVLSDLIPNTQYEIRVAGIVEIRDDVTVQSPNGSERGITSALAPPSVNITNKTPTTVRVCWSEINAPAQSWTVVLQKVIMDNRNEEIYQKQVSVNGDTQSTVFDGLFPATQYKAKVFGTVNGYKSPLGQARNTTDFLTAPQVEVIDTSLSKMTVRWSSINNNVSTWLVQVINSKLGQVKRFEVNPFQRDVVLSDLKPSTQYEVSVTGVIEIRDNVTVQSPAGSYRETTIYLGGPHVDCVETSSSSVTVEWSNDEIVQVFSWIIKIFPEDREDLALEERRPANARRYTFSQMRPSTTYIVEVKGKVREGNAEFDTPVMRDSCTTRPSPPSDLKVTQRGVTRLQAQFAPSTSEVLGYEGHCQPKERSQSNDFRRAVITNDFMVECFNLNPATDYNISVYSTFHNLNSEPITTTNSTLAPSPYGTTLLDPSTHTMLAEWQAPDLPVDEYEISYYANVTNASFITVNGNNNTLLLTNLEPDTTYFLSVKAIINGIKSSPDVTSERTLQELIPLQIEDVTFTSINVSWVRSSVPHAQSYVLEYFPMKKRDERKQVVLPPDTTHYLLRNLNTATDHVVTIKVNYRSTTSPVTQRHVTTLALSPKGPITFTNVTESGFVARWLPPDGDPQPTNYFLMYYDHRMAPVTIEGINGTEYTFDDLRPSTVYNVTVWAVYSNDLESHAIRATETTLEREEDCSCRTYVRTQAQMQSLLRQMMDKIDALTQKVEDLTRTRRRSRRRGGSRNF